MTMTIVNRFNSAFQNTIHAISVLLIIWHIICGQKVELAISFITNINSGLNSEETVIKWLQITLSYCVRSHF